MVSQMHGHGPTLYGIYDFQLVAASVLIAFLAAYAALDLAGRVTATRGLARLIWLICGAFAMGIGIWSMHYIGMEAMRLPATCRYFYGRVGLSIARAIIISFIALWLTFAMRGQATSGTGESSDAH
jgi:two-component system, sensor histidine kinase and response regulator